MEKGNRMKDYGQNDSCTGIDAGILRGLGFVTGLGVRTTFHLCTTPMATLRLSRTHAKSIAGIIGHKLGQRREEKRERKSKSYAEFKRPHRVTDSSKSPG